MPFRTSAAVLAVLAAAACGGERERAADAAAAARAEAALPAMPPPTLARFDVPLAYDFTDILQVVERAVPKTFGSLKERTQIGDDPRKQYAFAATRGLFTAYAHGSQVYLRTTLSYAARAYYKTPLGPTVSTGCGKEGAFPRITVELVAPLTLSPTWHLKSAARISTLVPVSDTNRDHCLVSILKLDMTDKVIDGAKKALAAKLPDIDRQVAKIDLTKKATGWWTHLSRPIRLTDEVWLLLQPKQLRLKGVTGEQHTLNVQAGLDAYPIIVTGPEPYATTSPLPPLASDTGTTGFRVLIDGVLDYRTASMALSDSLRGKSLTQGKRTIIVQSVVAEAEPGGRLALMVSFTGDATGTLRFVGAPTYNAAARKIAVADLDFDLNTDSKLIDTYAWLRSEALLMFFRQKAQVPVAPVLDRTKELITKGLNRTIDGVLTLAASVDSVTVVDLAATPRGLMLRARVSGDAHVSVKPKKKPK